MKTDRDDGDNLGGWTNNQLDHRSRSRRQWENHLTGMLPIDGRLSGEIHTNSQVLIGRFSDRCKVGNETTQGEGGNFNMCMDGEAGS